MIKFGIPFFKTYCFLHKDNLDLLFNNNIKSRIGIMWFKEAFPIAWYYVSKTWNITFNVDRKYWFSVWDWRKY